MEEETQSTKCTVHLTFDFDAEAMWEFIGMTTRCPMSRGEYGAKVGVPRILNLLDKYNIRATFFVPGVTIERHRNVVKEIHSRGHEIAHHSYAHSNPAEQGREEEEQDMVKAIEAIESISGLAPNGYRSPASDFSDNTLSLLEKYGFKWESSMLRDDFNLYHPAKTHLSKEKLNLVEIPFAWELDDAAHFLFNFFPNYKVGMGDPDKVLRIWKSEFEGAYKSMGYLTVCMHPQIIGKYHRTKMLEEFIKFVVSHKDVVFSTCSESVETFTNRNGQLLMNP